MNQLKLDSEAVASPQPGKTTAEVSIRDFDIIKPISRGSYGSVFLAQKKTTKAVYAIKLLKKSEMRTKNQREHVRSERNALALADNPFVVKMFFSFQSKVNRSFNIHLTVLTNLLSSEKLIHGYGILKWRGLFRFVARINLF